jgi:hypothetical protein
MEGKYTVFRHIRNPSKPQQILSTIAANAYMKAMRRNIVKGWFIEVETANSNQAI